MYTYRFIKKINTGNHKTDVGLYYELDLPFPPCGKMKIKKEDLGLFISDDVYWDDEYKMFISTVSPDSSIEKALERKNQTPNIKELIEKYIGMGWEEIQ